MRTPQAHPSDLQKTFVSVAHQLGVLFPDLDLRFSLQSGSETLRFMAADISREVHEVSLVGKSTNEILHQAIFAIKEICGRFDA